ESGCQKCSGPQPTDCTECFSGFRYINKQCECFPSGKRMRAPYSFGGCPESFSFDRYQEVCVKCLDSCPVGFFYDANIHFCVPCAENCEVCTGPKATQCLKCVNGFFLDLISHSCTNQCS